METEWDTGYFIGINSRTTEYLIAQGSGIFSAATIQRHQDDKAYDPDIVKEVTILHRDYVMRGSKSTPTEVRPHTAATSTPNPRGAPADPTGKRARSRPAKREDAMDDEKRSDTLGVQGSTAADFARKLSGSGANGSSRWRSGLCGYYRNGQP